MITATPAPAGSPLTAVRSGPQISRSKSKIAAQRPASPRGVDADGMAALVAVHRDIATTRKRLKSAMSSGEHARAAQFARHLADLLELLSHATRGEK